MGNKLTVANATDNDIYAYASVIEYEVQKVTADIGTRPSGGITIGEDNVKLGWVAIGPTKAWTFPKLVLSRYYLTVVKKGYAELISNGLQIAWRTNVIVTPDNKLAVARSGSVWMDASDKTDYRSKPCHDSVDASSTLCQALPSNKFLKIFESNPQIEEFVQSLCRQQLSDTDRLSTRREIAEILQVLSDKLVAYSPHRELPNVELLVDILKQEPFDMPQPDVDYIFGKLTANEEVKQETDKCLRLLLAE